MEYRSRTVYYRLNYAHLNYRTHGSKLNLELDSPSSLLRLHRSW